MCLYLSLRVSNEEREIFTSTLCEFVKKIILSGSKKQEYEPALCRVTSDFVIM